MCAQKQKYAHAALAAKGVSQALVNRVHAYDLDPCSHNYPWMDIKTPSCWILIVNNLVSFCVWSGIKASRRSLFLQPTNVTQTAWGQIQDLTYFSAVLISALQCGQMNYMWTFFICWPINSWSQKGFAICLKDTIARKTQHYHKGLNQDFRMRGSLLCVVPHLVDFSSKRYSYVFCSLFLKGLNSWFIGGHKMWQNDEVYDVDHNLSTLYETRHN